jgi:hypothetical protein
MGNRAFNSVTVGVSGRVAVKRVAPTLMMSLVPGALVVSGLLLPLCPGTTREESSLTFILHAMIPMRNSRNKLIRDPFMAF